MLLARYFKKGNTNKVNEEVEVNFNVVINEIPIDYQWIIEDIKDKEGKLKITTFSRCTVCKESTIHCLLLVYRKRCIY